MTQQSVIQVSTSSRDQTDSPSPSTSDQPRSLSTADAARPAGESPRPTASVCGLVVCSGAYVTASVPHVFQAFTGLLDEADQALDRAALFITQHLAAPSA